MPDLSKYTDDLATLLRGWFTNGAEIEFSEWQEDARAILGADVFGRIVADVREQVAQEIEDAALALATTEASDGYALTAAILNRAARIARGGAL